MEELADGGERPELAPAAGEQPQSRAMGILLPCGQVWCCCCLKTAPCVAAKSKPMSGVAGVNGDVSPWCVSSCDQPLPGNCVAGTQLVPGEDEVSLSNGLFTCASGSGLHCREVGASEAPEGEDLPLV